MGVMPPSREDKAKSFFYKELENVGDFQEYVRNCMRLYDNEKFGKLEKRVANAFTLEDVLLKTAEDFQEFRSKNNLLVNGSWIGKRKRKSYDLFDKRAFVYITRCFRKDMASVLKYYRFYRNLKNGIVDVYIDYKEEEIPFAEDVY